VVSMSDSSVITGLSTLAIEAVRIGAASNVIAGGLTGSVSLTTASFLAVSGKAIFATGFSFGFLVDAVTSVLVAVALGAIGFGVSLGLAVDAVGVLFFTWDDVIGLGAFALVAIGLGISFGLVDGTDALLLGAMEAVAAVGLAAIGLDASLGLVTAAVVASFLGAAVEAVAGLAGVVAFGISLGFAEATVVFLGDVAGVVLLTEGGDLVSSANISTVGGVPGMTGVLS